MRLRKAWGPRLCGWVGECFAARAGLGRSPLPCRAGAVCPQRLRGAGCKSRPVSEGLRGRARRAGGAREPRPARAVRGCPRAGAPHGGLAIAAGKAPGRRRRSRGSEPGPSGPRTPSCAAPGAAPALDSWRRRLPSRRLPPLPAARPEFPSPAPAGPSSGHCPRSLRPGHTRPPAGERPAPLGFVPNSASALLGLPPAPRQSPPSPVPAPALAGSPSLPRPRSFHTNSHSSHSSLPPFKLQGK